MSAKLHVERMGSGPRVMLLHSQGLSGKQWRRLATLAVERGFSVVIPDFTGHGASAGWTSAAPFTYRVDVERIVELLQEEPARVVGHSYGGFVALQAARMAPKQVESITVYDPVAFGVLDPARDAAGIADLAAVGETWTRLGDEEWLQSFVDFWGGAGAWRALREEVRAEFRKTVSVTRPGVHSLADDDTAVSAYSVIDAPAHLLAGQLSPRVAKSVVHRLAEVLPRARITEVEGAGHLGPVTHASMVNELFLDDKARS